MCFCHVELINLVILSLLGIVIGGSFSKETILLVAAIFTVHVNVTACDIFNSVKAGGVTFSFVPSVILSSVCLSVCEQDSSRTRKRTSTKHGRRG